MQSLEPDNSSVGESHTGKTDFEYDFKERCNVKVLADLREAAGMLYKDTRIPSRGS